MSGPYTQPLVYFFGQGRADGTAAMKDVLGGKGAGLAEMTTIGIPVPPGFTIASSLCLHYLESHQFPKRLRVQVENALQRLETATGKHFGDGDNPLLVSVRSGAAVSMPGMMETILNLGLNDVTVEGPHPAERQPALRLGLLSPVRADVRQRGVRSAQAAVRADPGGAPPALRRRARHRPARWTRSQALVRRVQGAHPRRDRPRVPRRSRCDQLWGAIAAVFESWNTRRAIDYRKLHDIPDTMGTAVNIVAMVFGNMGEDSGTGVAFSRDPSTGERGLYGEYLLNAQGEDVVSGSRTPLPIATLKERLPARLPGAGAGGPHPGAALPRRAGHGVHHRAGQALHAADPAGPALGPGGGADRLRHGGRGADLRGGGGRADPAQRPQSAAPSDHRSHSQLDLLTTGLPASPGAACGTVVFDADQAEQLGRAGQPVILVRRETSPEDFHGMVMAKAILTARGGMTSHAAVVARGMGKPCVAGAQALQVDEKAGRFSVNGRSIAEGDWITVDGSTGKVFAGQAALVTPELSGNFLRLMQWADRIRQLRVRVNADTPADAHRGRDFGAEGIGLCRTEHMFFDGDRLTAMREMIVAAGHAPAASGPWPSCCRCSAPTSRQSSAPWRATRSPSGCSIRRCTSSCPRTPREIEALAARAGHAGGSGSRRSSTGCRR